MLACNVLGGRAETFQSEQCTEEELRARTQCMRRLPEKEYSIPLGYTVLLPCEIANQHGKAQWNANEILLGKSIKLSK